MPVKSEDLRGENVALLRLLADIRAAVGDDGKRMQDELVAYCAELKKDRDRLECLFELAVKNRTVELEASPDRDDKDYPWSLSVTLEGECLAIGKTGRRVIDARMKEMGVRW